MRIKVPSTAWFTVDELQHLGHAVNFYKLIKTHKTGMTPLEHRSRIGQAGLKVIIFITVISFSLECIQIVHAINRSKTPQTQVTDSVDDLEHMFSYTFELLKRDRKQ